MLLSHSMGSPFSLYFLHQQTQQWKDAFVKGWITISGITLLQGFFFKTMLQSM